MIATAPHWQPALLAVDGDLDPTFGKGGKVRTNFSGRSNDIANSLAIQPDGKIVTSGFIDVGAGLQLVLARYNPNGTLDATFGDQGRVITHLDQTSELNAVAIQRDGKIVVASSIPTNSAQQDDFDVTRFSADGSLDPTFGVGGMVTTDFGDSSDEVRAILIQSDGHIVVVGQAIVKFATTADIAIARYNKDGSLDQSFGAGGKVTTDIDAIDDGRSVAIQRDGKIVVAGFVEHEAPVPNGVIDRFVVVRYEPNGALDATFGIDGVAITDFGPEGPAQANSVMIQNDGKILAAGTVAGSIGTLEDFAIVRYAPNGMPDHTFGANGVVLSDLGSTADFETAAALQTDGKIVVAGSASDKFAVARYNTNGLQDLTFGTNGVARVDFSTPTIPRTGDELRAMAIQSDGKIVAAGFSISLDTLDEDLVMARFQASNPSTTPSQP